MTILNPKDIINKSKIIETIAQIYSQKLNIDYDDALSMINKKVDQKLNEIGEKITNSNIVTKKQALSLDEVTSEQFFKNKKMIKEE